MLGSTQHVYDDDDDDVCDNDFENVVVRMMMMMIIMKMMMMIMKILTDQSVAAKQVSCKAIGIEQTMH